MRLTDGRAKVDLSRKINELEAENSALDDYIFAVDIKPSAVLGPPKPIKHLTYKSFQPKFRRHRYIQPHDPMDLSVFNRMMEHLHDLELRLTNAEAELFILKSKDNAE